ncbi:AMP-binding protein [Chitinimonas arctica]|uniref:AMP-binding protein n=1 Tax=Chitinimonas arctica TaxID=2594795 RepID=A0A516SCT9_9NEIS|nr:AMP-binding protein [Chitinimonas arctica]QDQ25966.1 AMP-binding protein [Chitinimonas arctica]
MEQNRHFAPAGAVHQALAHYARTRPEDVFLLAEGGVSYGQAAAWVAALADEQLAGMAQQRVAIWMSKGNRYAMAILASLYAGACYVPLDGGQPVHRAAGIVEDAEARVLIVDSAHLAELQLLGVPDCVERLVLLLAEGEAAPQLDDARLLVLHDASLYERGLSLAAGEPVAPDCLAAILYTSGSTGKPKGVQLSHRNLANFINWCGEELGLRREDRLLNIASFNFDLSTFDLFGSLRHGAAVYVSHEQEQQAISRLADILRYQDITVLYTVPSLLALISRAGIWDAVAPLRLRHVIFAGEVMPMPQLQSLARYLPATCQLYNFYGPTETNVCLFHKVTKADLLSASPLPIGKPIRGAEVWLRNKEGDPLGTDDGHIGEIWVAGACVTPGYWRRHDPANAENHLLNQHATGDYGSYRNGILVYHGRIDRMLKLNGYRVELGEIESVLATHPDIAEVAVVAEQGQSVRLMVYLATRDADVAIGIADLKTFCATRLPKYMIPHGLCRLEALPKNANGKIDYRALADADKLVSA